ncbi:MAG: hypothetical protein AAFN68_03635 [Pseudomonadota bacterium]
MASSRLVALLIVLLLPFVARAADDNVVRLQGISIQGNSEEPHVIYITPWRPPPGTGRLYQPIYSYREHWLQPVDRNSLGRELRYGERYLPKSVNQDRVRQLTEAANKNKK